eukprot:TRINITY_DN67474_c3_g1_i1.p1 TRINITY_DN67474_c3_g1~~TRINITY_DN67474_c3_g1_i1.p1  ORF type:complete len:641 (-),score=414.11 TRINITY_DN67474_c3_g1_i1:69-1991(-)
MRGRETKKGTKGAVANYLTRTQAIRKLQITLKDFRRLCILKAIFPRDPKRKNRISGADKSYYHKKDIQFLAHEPLLAEFRKMKTFLKRYKKLKQRRELKLAERFAETSRPEFELDHLVKERYPSFVDALRDLDDPLTLVFLFASLPTGTTKQHQDKHVEKCQRLSREFQQWAVRAHSLRKVFVSIKGIYYQCVVQGEEITWLVPHQFSQHKPKNVDFRVMLTFLDFYLTMLEFVNFKLYHDLGLHYPPKLIKDLDEAGEGLGSLRIMSAEEARRQQEANQNNSVNNNSNSAAGTQKINKELQSKVQEAIAAVAEDGDEDSDDAEDAAAQDDNGDDEDFPDQSTEIEETPEQKAAREEEERIAKLFSGLHFYLSRETAQDALEFVILAAGGRVTRYSVEYHKKQKKKKKKKKQQTDKVTHQIVDRPALPSDAVQDGRVFVQPQWVFDSFNTRALLPTDPYAVGAALPPHLSPFVDDEKEGYVPKQRQVLAKWGAAANGQSVDDEDDVDDDEEEEGDSGNEDGDSDQDESDDDDDGDESDDEDKEDDDEEEEEQPKKKKQKKNKKRKREEEAKELAKIMMPKKDRRLYQRMQYGIKKKADANAKLEARRVALEKQKKKQSLNDNNNSDEHGAKVKRRRKNKQ